MKMMLYRKAKKRGGIRISKAAKSLA